MPLIDSGAIETEAMLDNLEKQIGEQYRDAEREMRQKMDRYLNRYEANLKRKTDQLNKGLITSEEFETWKRNRAYDKQWYESMVDTLSRDALLSDQKAMSLVFGYLPEAYAVNHNFSAFQLEQGVQADMGFTLYSRETVERIMRDQPDLLPDFTPDDDADYKWHKQKFNTAIMQGILQGEAIPKIARRVKDVTDMDNRAAVRNARTAMTGAQNAGRQDAYEHAEQLGIEVQKEWMATLDGRTRHTHRQLDGERVKLNETFSNHCEYPGDPRGAGSEVYNCRCTMVPYLPDYPPAKIEYQGTRMNGMTYEEWKGAKAPRAKGAPKKEERHLKVIDSLISANVEAIAFDRIKGKVVADEIIKRIGGGDLTQGSCASLALVYAGNMAGCDVLDFRDGASRKWFSSKENWRRLYEELGVPYMRATKKTNIAGAKELMKKMEDGKDYILEAGCHASVVRIENGIYKYLELQNPSPGWKSLGDNLKDCDRIIRWRFGHMGDAFPERYRPTMVKVDDLVANEDFPRILEYINTASEKQRKGVMGYER